MNVIIPTKQQHYKTMDYELTLKEWRQQIEEALTDAGFDNASLEAKWLLAAVLKRDPAFITLEPNYVLSSSETLTLQSWLKRRLQGEPLSRIRGYREFWSLPFHVNEHTLDPRPDTEIVVEGVLKWVGERKDHPWHILDLGTGTGCLLISLLHELKKATGVGVDLSQETLSTAQENAILNKVSSRCTFYQSNWGKGLQEKFDIIVSNPPYIPLQNKKTLGKEVLHYDPPLALFGGEDGFDCYRILSEDIPSLLSPHGISVLEIGMGQKEVVEALFHEKGFSTLFIMQDLAGIERALGFTLP
jgi:release factor glutamine methyltransferase